jgi:antitoxin component YwqK of YwqJK toxin-antitoxin module
MILGIVACNKSTTSTPGVGINLTGYELEKVKGTDTEYAVLKNPTGGMLAEGMIKNGVQEGIWITYFEEEEGNRIKTISNFVNGKMNGPYIEMNNRSQIEKRVNYLNDQVHGLYAEYKFGRPLKEYNYNNGILEGVSKEYNDRGKLIKETAYKNGKLNGIIKQYDEDGNVILEYEYKNGEKISGGIVDAPASN